MCKKDDVKVDNLVYCEIFVVSIDIVVLWSMYVVLNVF